LEQFRGELEGLLTRWRRDPAQDPALICPNLNV